MSRKAVRLHKKTEREGKDQCIGRIFLLVKFGPTKLFFFRLSGSDCLAEADHPNVAIVWVMCDADQ